MSAEVRLDAYRPLRVSRSDFVMIRGLGYHVRIWDPVAAPLAGTGSAKQVFLLHGWMDVSASFQFVVDHLPGDWRLVAPDWRGFGLTQWPAAERSVPAKEAPADRGPWRRIPAVSYSYPDYLADLDALLDHYAGQAPVDLVGHSMGGNATTLYAGVRPARVRRLVNLEGVGMRATTAEQAPARYAQYLDEIAAGVAMADYASLAAVAARLMKNNPRLRADFAAWLAGHWSRRREDGRFELLGDPAHKLINPVLYRVEEALACWRAITAPVLFVLSQHLNEWHHFVDSDEYRSRLNAFASLQRATVADAGHMMHHDQPLAVARLIEGFLS